MKRIWVITDGRAGNESQALGLAEAVAELLPAEITVKRIQMPLVLRPTWLRWLWRLGRPRWPGWPFAGLADRGRALAPPWPDLVIGAGGRSAPIAAAMRRIARERGEPLRAVQLMHPRMPASAFDLVLVPVHDDAVGSNVIRTMGALNRVTPRRLRQAAEVWQERLGFLPRPRVAVLIGGPSWSARFGRRAAAQLTRGLKRLAEAGAGMMITPSPRTPPHLVEELRDSLAPHLERGSAWLWSGEGENPYFGMLGLADAVVVTEDSVSMTSEAAATGRPVLVSPIDRVSKRIARFHAVMREAGYTRPFTGELVSGSCEPLHETARVAPRVAALLEEGGGA